MQYAILDMSFVKQGAIYCFTKTQALNFNFREYQRLLDIEHLSLQGERHQQQGHGHPAETSAQAAVVTTEQEITSSGDIPEQGGGNSYLNSMIESNRMQNNLETPQIGTVYNSG